jgi:hypothetical protein
VPESDLARSIFGAGVENHDLGTPMESAEYPVEKLLGIPRDHNR